MAVGGPLCSRLQNFISVQGEEVDASASSSCEARRGGRCAGLLESGAKDAQDCLLDGFG